MTEPGDSPYDFAPERQVTGEDVPPSSGDGAAARESPPTAPSPRHPLVERPCPQCGFLIVGKPRQNRCPECRAQLDDSPADLLQLAHAGWIRRISMGAMLLAGAVAVHVGGVLVVMIKHNAVIGVGLHVLAAAVILAGIWLLTMPEEGTPRQQSFFAAASRWLSLSGMILWIGAAVAASKNPPSAVWLMLPAVIVMASESAALGMFASGLASRIPHDGLTNQLRNFAIFLPPFFGIVLVGMFTDIAPYYTIFFCSLPLIGALLGLMAWVTLTFLRLFLELRHVATAADAIAQKLAAKTAKPAPPAEKTA